jgi:hypothetical protein
MFAQILDLLAQGRGVAILAVARDHVVATPTGPRRAAQWNRPTAA